MALIQAVGALGQGAMVLIQAAVALGQAALFRLLPAACAFCASSSRDNKAAYIGTTLLLLGLPLGFLSALLIWLIRRSR